MHLGRAGETVRPTSRGNGAFARNPRRFLLTLLPHSYPATLASVNESPSSPFNCRQRARAPEDIANRTRQISSRIRRAGLVVGLVFGLTAAALAAETATAPGGLEIGFAQTDITPEVGVLMTGAGIPASTGVDDPLFARTLVARSGGRTLAVVGVDLVKIRLDLADAAIAEAARRTGIERNAVIVCCSHNHSSPFIPMGGPNNTNYLANLPGLIADSIARAHQALQPARMFLGRSLVFDGVHNRRVITKADGLSLNTWLTKLNDLKQTPQVLGVEGPIDPELWVARFDALDGKTLGTVVNFTCHPSLHDRRGRRWSADFPGVIADRMAQVYGEHSVAVFTQGASGNINPNSQFIPDWREKAGVFAEAAATAARRAIPVEGAIAVDYTRRDLLAPRRDPGTQREGALERLGWRHKPGGAPPRSPKTPVNAARIGPLGIATNAGELFVEWGIDIKRRSPFPHTIVCELSNEWVGYEPTEKAFKLEAYETLNGVNFVSLEGIRLLTDTAVAELEDLWKKGGR